MIRYLNLYPGVGGNRKLLPKDVKVTAVEIVPAIARIYKQLYPEDTVIVGDAHEYLREHHAEFDFIWSSRPCKTHSKARFLASKNFKPPVRPGNYPPLYPDLKLYEEIIFLENYFDGKWVVENVVPFYEPLIKPRAIISKNAFWANFRIDQPSFKLSNRYHFNTVPELQEEKGIDLSCVDTTGLNKTELLRNCVHPGVGLHVFECAFSEKQKTLEVNGIPPMTKVTGILPTIL